MTTPETVTGRGGDAASRRNPTKTCRRTGSHRAAIATVWLVATGLFPSAGAADSRASQVPTFTDVTVHDPSVVRVGADFYVFGSHLASARTRDGQHWTQVTTDTTAAQGNALVPDPQVQFQEALAWVGSNTFWAPDVIRLPDGRFYFYYCVGRLDAPVAALGVAVSSSITGPYTNLGVMRRSGAFGQPSDDGTNYDPTVHPNTVDPDVFFDRDGRLWMVYGSYSGGIFILEMNPATGFPLPNQGYGKKLIGGNHSRIEGAFVLYSPESYYYYLFLSFGGLDSNGGYNIRLGRSRHPDGPYFDAAGNELTEVKGAPGTLFDDASIAPFGVKLMGSWQFLPVPGEPAATTTGYRSPGHNSAYYDPRTGQYFLVFHTRFAGRGEEHQVRVHQLYLNEDDWLVAAPHRYAGERLDRTHRGEVPGQYKLLNHGKAISPAMNTSVLVTLERDGEVSGPASGRWSLGHRGDFRIVLGDVTYHGVFSTQWDDDNGAWVRAFSALSEDGVAVWGSQPVLSRHPPRRVTLRARSPLYGMLFTLALPRPHGNRGDAYSYSVVSGPAGLVLDRATGILTWRPSLSDVGVPYEVTVRALKTEVGDPDQTWYTFTLTASSSTVVRRLDLSFSAAASGGLADANGLFTGLTTRLPGTGTAVPALDPNLRLDPTGGVLALKTTRADFNGAAGLDANSSPGVALADFGFTGSEDFAATVVFRPLPGLQFIDQVGLYVGASSGALTRAGTIVFAAPERYSVHSENGGDHGGRFFGFGLDGTDGMTVTITREGGVWRYSIDGVEWNPLAPPAFLDGRPDLVAGLFAITPLNSNAKTIEIDSFSLVVATSEPLPPAH
jgi:arabinan endo-1,5-alpha-L-arabinosidase